jgi:hypothetical protein
MRHITSIFPIIFRVQLFSKSVVSLSKDKPCSQELMERKDLLLQKLGVTASEPLQLNFEAYMVSFPRFWSVCNTVGLRVH